MHQTSELSYDSYSSRTLLPLQKRWSRQPPTTFITENRKIHLQGVRARRPKDAKRRVPQCAGEREKRELWFLFLCFSLPGPVLCKLGQPGVLFVLREVLTPVLGPSFVLFRGLFPSRSFSHGHSGLLFPILTTWEYHQINTNTLQKLIPRLLEVGDSQPKKTTLKNSPTDKW